MHSELFKKTKQNKTIGSQAHCNFQSEWKLLPSLDEEFH